MFIKKWFFRNRAEKPRESIVDVVQSSVVEVLEKHGYDGEGFISVLLWIPALHGRSFEPALFSVNINKFTLSATQDLVFAKQYSSLQDKWRKSRRKDLFFRDNNICYVAAHCGDKVRDNDLPTAECVMWLPGADHAKFASEMYALLDSFWDRLCARSRIERVA